MWKKMLLVLVMLSFMVGTAFAGIEEMRKAWSKDRATCLSEAGKVIADPASSAGDRGLAKVYKGFCGVPDTTMTDEEFSAIHPRNTVEYVYHLPKADRGDWTKKSAALVKPILLDENQASVFYYIHDFMLADLGGQDFLLKVLQRDAVFNDIFMERKKLNLCTQETLKQANLGERALTLLNSVGNDTSVRAIRVAYTFLNKVALGKEEYLKLLDTMILTVPANEKNAEFLGLLKSEQEKLR